jgi:hypothetical protein
MAADKDRSTLIQEMSYRCSSAFICGQLNEMQNHEWYSDTDPKAFAVFRSRQRAMTSSEKLQAVFEQIELLRSMAESRERQIHPQATDREIFLRVTAHRLDRETMLRVYGWHPDSSE